MLSGHVLRDLILKLPDEELVPLLEHLDPDEATDILRHLPKKKNEKIVGNMNEQLRKDVQMLLSFQPHTAADLMSLDYIIVDHKDTIGDIAKKVSVHEKRTGKLPIILVTENEELKGFIAGHNLGLSKPSDIAEKYVSKISTISYNSSDDEVMEFFTKLPHSKVVVLGENKNILGIIFSDDVIRLIKEHESASLYDFAGVNEEESIYDPARRKVKFRYKWLILNVFTTFIAASVVGIFQHTIEKEVLLAVYMPIVAGMGGNAGTQTLAVMVRGLSFSQLKWREVFSTLKHEVTAGFVNGLINGVVVFTVVMFLNQSVLVGTVLAFAMVINLIVSSTFGTIVPVVMKKLGKDPASSASIFITTATDVFGFLAFLGLATFLLAR